MSGCKPQPPKKGQYRATVSLPAHIARLAKHAAVDEDQNLSEWMASLVYRELRTLGLLKDLTPPTQKQDRDSDDEP